MASVLMDAERMVQIEDRLISEILALHPKLENFVLAGIQRRGADLAKRFVKKLAQLGHAVEAGSLDINLYRDDWTAPDGIPSVGISQMPPSIAGKTVLLVDDVLFTGRTIRAALEAVLDYGRPAAVELLAFVDRGGRELPIAATYSGAFVECHKDWRIDVLLEERDGEDCVIMRTDPD